MFFNYHFHVHFLAINNLCSASQFMWSASRSNRNPLTIFTDWAAVTFWIPRHAYLPAKGDHVHMQSKAQVGGYHFL